MILQYFFLFNRERAIAQNRIGLRHIAFEVENIDEVTEKLKSKGVEFLSPVQTHPQSGKRLVYFLGPDGILLELAQYS